MANQIKSSSTGMLHLGASGSTNADCNQNMRCNAVSLKRAQNAAPEMLCRKCFSGKYKGHAQLDLLVSLGHFETAA